MPMLSGLLTNFAEQLTGLENYETQDGTAPGPLQLVKVAPY